MVVPGKCVVTFCFIFIICPRQIRPALAVHKLQQNYYHARRGWGPVSLNSRHTDTSDYRDPLYKRDSMNGVIHKEVRNDENTAGFDLTDEEMIKFKIWPQGVIPYYIDVISFKDKVLRDRIRGFLNVVNGLTGLNFLELLVPPQDEKRRWVFFINRRGLLDCADHSTKNFTNEGVQHVILGYDCMSTGGELAEAVLAIAGLPSQHTAPNRDEYIRVVDENIIPAKRHLYEKLQNDEWLFHDVAYDFYSAGHYHSHKYSANGRATIETQKNFVDIPVGEGNGLSNSDILKIRMLYSYISKQKHTHLPECHKLFEPGKLFSSFKPVDNNVKPRKKPNKYLDIADNEIIVAGAKKNNNDDDRNDAHDRNEKDPDNNEDVKNQSDVNDDLNNEPEENEDVKNESDNNDVIKETKGNEDDNLKNKRFKEAYEDNQSDNDKNTERNIDKVDLKVLKQKKFNDPISILSDYQTEDEKPKKKLKLDIIPSKFNKMGEKNIKKKTKN